MLCPKRVKAWHPRAGVKTEVGLTIECDLCGGEEAIEDGVDAGEP